MDRITAHYSIDIEPRLVLHFGGLEGVQARALCEVACSAIMSGAKRREKKEPTLAARMSELSAAIWSAVSDRVI